MLLLRDGVKLTSSGWARLEQKTSGTARLVQASYSPASGALRAAAVKTPALKTPLVPLDLLITLELAKIDNPRYRRPYVAVWVEDAAKTPVRTISLWSEKPRWLDELRSWYHDYPSGISNGGQMSPSISSATRPAGKYTLRWDGKDDKGVTVKPGKYTILVEAAREHGGYDLMHEEINFDGKTSAQASMPAGKEIAGVELDYGKHVD